MTTPIERIGPREILVSGDASWIKSGMRVTSECETGRKRGGFAVVCALTTRKNGLTLVTVDSAYEIVGIYPGDLLVQYRDEMDDLRDELAELKRRVDAMEAERG